jgi:hypothetical protein
MSALPQAIKPHRRIALAALAALRLTLLPIHAMLGLARGLVRLASNLLGLMALNLAGDRHCDDEDGAIASRWRQLGLSPLWFPVALVMVLRHVARSSFAGLAATIGHDIQAACRMLMAAARGR